MKNKTRVEINAELQKQLDECPPTKDALRELKTLTLSHILEIESKEIK